MASTSGKRKAPDIAEIEHPAADCMDTAPGSSCAPVVIWTIPASMVSSERELAYNPSDSVYSSPGAVMRAESLPASSKKRPERAQRLNARLLAAILTDFIDSLMTIRHEGLFQGLLNARDATEVAPDPLPSALVFLPLAWSELVPAAFLEIQSALSTSVLVDRIARKYEQEGIQLPAAEIVSGRIHQYHQKFVDTMKYMHIKHVSSTSEVFTYLSRVHEVETEVVRICVVGIDDLLPDLWGTVTPIDAAAAASLTSNAVGTLAKLLAGGVNAIGYLTKPETSSLAALHIAVANPAILGCNAAFAASGEDHPWLIGKLTDVSVSSSAVVALLLRYSAVLKLVAP